MQVIITGRIADSAGALENGRVEFAQAQRIDNGELIITGSIATANVVNGELRSLSGEPFQLPSNPEGTAVRIREILGGQTFEWWAAVPEEPSVEYRNLKIMESGSAPASVWGPPPWLAVVEQMRDETVDAINEGIAVAEALGGLPGIQGMLEEATESAAASSASASAAKASATSASSSASSASGSASGAAGAASAASASATAAAKSKTDADAAKAAAESAKAAAETSKTAAATSATSAASSATSAATAKTGAESAKAAAESAKTAAEASKSSAQTEANRAKTEADRAKAAADSVDMTAVNQRLNDIEGTANNAVPKTQVATTTVTGITKLATDAIAAAGTSTNTVITPKQLGVSGRSSTQAALDAVPPSVLMSQMEAVVKFPAREGGQVSWPQGFDINIADNEIYVSNIDGNKMRIDIRNLATGARKSFKEFTIDSGTFTQSLSWHKNAAGDLLFVVWPVSHDGGAVSAKYKILNYTKGTFGPAVEIRGKSMGCRDGDYFVTGYINAFEVYQINVYTWASVAAGAPVLVRSFNVSNPGQSNGKAQGIAALGGDTFISMGAQGELPGVTAYDPNGNLVREDTWGLLEFGAMVNRAFPGTVSGDDYKYENEGATSAGGNVYTLHIMMPTSGGSDVVIVKHGGVGGVRVPARPGPAAVEWTIIPENLFAAGVTPVAANPPRVRLNAGYIEFDGELTHANLEATGLFQRLFNLSDALYYMRPRSAEGFQRRLTFEVGNNTTAKRVAQVTFDGGFNLYLTAKTANPLPLNSIRYPII